MKKETLEEACERAVKSGLFKDETLFIAGSKWQQERSYSQLDIIRILSKYETLSNEDFNEFFKQFKKK